MTTTADDPASSCLFCRIVAGDAPAEILHATDTLIAFRDLRPKAPTHILLIPKEHLVQMSDLREGHAGMLVDVFEAATHLARTEGIERSGWRIVANEGGLGSVGVPPALPPAGRAAHGVAARVSPGTRGRRAARGR